MPDSVVFPLQQFAPVLRLSGRPGGMGMTAGHISELLTPEPWCFCSLLPAPDSCPSLVQYTKEQLPIRVLKLVPIINRNPRHGVVSFIKLLAVLKTCLGMQEGCPAACPELWEDESSQRCPVAMNSVPFAFTGIRILILSSWGVEKNRGGRRGRQGRCSKTVAVFCA